MTELEKLRRAFRKHLYLPDPAVLEVAVATYVAHEMTGDPVWLQIVGPSGSGKTEVIRALDGLRRTYPISSLTPKTLLSGAKCPVDDNGAPIHSLDPSLLKRADAAGTTFLTLKDFTTVLTMQRESRAAILSQLREIYDGSYVAAFGTGRTVEWEGRIGFLAGVTPVIDAHRSAMSILGERFMYLRLGDVDRTVLSAAARLQKDEGAMREALSRAVSRYIGALDFSAAIPESDGAWLDALAVIASWVRTGVLRDEYRLEVQFRPQLDAPTRFVKQLSSLHAALVVMGHEDPRSLVRRVARDSVLRDRWDALFLLVDAEDGRRTTRQLCEGMNIPRSQYKTVQRMMEDLEMLGLVDVIREADPFPDDDEGRSTVPLKYTLTDEARESLRPLRPRIARIRIA